MDIAPVQKTTLSLESPAYLARPTGQAGSTPVATELAPQATVQQASAGFAAGNDAQQASEPPQPNVERHLTIDPQTREIVSQVIDQQSGDVMSQVPDQALLRLKTYARDMVLRMDAKQAEARLSRDA